MTAASLRAPQKVAGSSTELAPSLLGIYDTLTTTLDAGYECNSKNNNCNGTKDNTSTNKIDTSNTEYNKSSYNGIRSSSSTDNNADSFTDKQHSTAIKEQQAQHPLTNSTKHIAIQDSAQQTGTQENFKTRDLENKSNNTTSNNTINSISSKHRNNIRVLSANVQRLVTHSDAEPVDTVDIDALQAHLKSNALLSPITPQHYSKRACSTPNTHHSNHHNHIKTSQHKVKLSHIPLSKITGKLTQSGSELVETFDSSSEYLDALNFKKSDTKLDHHKSKDSKNNHPATLPILQISPQASEQTTPTNNDLITQFSYACDLNEPHHTIKLAKSFSQETIQLIEMEQLATTTQLLSSLTTAVSMSENAEPLSPENTAKSRAFIATEPPLTPLESVEAINFTLVAKNIEKLNVSEPQHNSSSSCNSSMSSMDSGSHFIEAINKPLISKSLVRSSSAACASTVVGSPLLTYARSKSLHPKANTLAIPIKLPTAEQLEELEEASRISAESLDRLTDIKSKFSPKETRKISGTLILPDIAKLKHRPLSSSSICSTSSSSSSGSDLLNGKQATSYLASVESLADQSETELVDPHTGMSVFERACLEIIDSERSYVEDLGQVIRGYLHDWKERACLRLVELQILFSNIEEIYEFNSTLLKQLINSGMDPVKIAKCFIELRERFDVYTKYCTQYPEAISLLTKLLQATHTNALLNSTQKMLQHTLPLGSYLLKPVQRILKYHLLLDNLRKHCDVKEVFQAYEIMRQVARNIDQVKRKLEQQSRVKELSGILDGWLGPELTVLGELRQEGLLMEHNKPRMVFLFGTMLIITKPKEDNRLQFKSYIHQNNLMLSEHLPGEPTSFYVIPYDEPRNQIKLTAKNRDQKRLWAQHIKGVILEKFDNIPNRAKELVYKLGDEEDRTPDKHTWKWSRNSTSSTPVYLERRNQYRRSEMRNRAKFKRKTVSNSLSFDSFNELAEEDNESSNIKRTKPVQRNNSIDESVLPTLQKFAAAMRNRSSKQPNHTSSSTPTQKLDANHCKISTYIDESNIDACTNKRDQCIIRDQRSSPKSPKFNYKALKERSKSVPRISFAADEETFPSERDLLHGSNSNLDECKSVSRKIATAVEIKQYNHKTLPKRISTLKKQRQSKKETSKFYLDLADFDKTTTETVLKITESTENLMEKQQKAVDVVDVQSVTTNAAIEDLYSKIVKQKESDSNLTPAEKVKRDAQIILDLLKHNKEFEKLCNKSQKKRSVDTSTKSPTKSLRATEELPPRPPSRSPPPLMTDNEDTNDCKTPNQQFVVEENEPIYESLLRNVHVPYKFSPLLGRAKSAQYTKQKEKKQTLPRPESDYVTLVYSPEGQLKQIGGECVVRATTMRQNSAPEQDHNGIDATSSSSSSTSSSTLTLKRDSQQTVISIESIITLENEREPTSTNGSTDAIYTRSMSKNLVKRLLHTGNSNKSSMENVSTSDTSLFPRSLKSIDNITLTFGRSNRPPERRVSDVSEMCRQSILHRQGSEALGERIAHLDYADPRTLFAVTTSESSLQRDSVFSLTSSNDSVSEQKLSVKTSMELTTNFEYEDDVEASLENDFRDSAIYSDDNEKQRATSPSQVPPPLPPSRSRKYPNVPPKPAHIPPAFTVSPTKPKLESRQQEMALPGVIVCPPHLSQAASRSWVLQQIENFNK